MKLRSVAFLSLLVAGACGPSGRSGDGNGNGDGPDASIGGAEICTDGADNDTDGRVDCSDIDCSGRDGCPVCGSVEQPEAQPLALPDGFSSGDVCSTDSQCVGTVDDDGNPTPNCVAKECHASYTSTLNFVGFADAGTLTDPNKLLKVCVNMEHSWLRDLQMELITPSGAVFILHKFVDRSGGETFLGNANDSDSDNAPVPGTGLEYCWTPAAPVSMIDAAVPTVDTLPAGDYKSISPWTALSGTTLNGEWTMRVTDLWGIDNGYLFSWKIEFDPSLVSDCAGPIIL